MFSLWLFSPYICKESLLVQAGLGRGGIQLTVMVLGFGAQYTLG